MSTAITFSRYGEPDVLTVSAAEVPQPGPGQVRIRVHAVAVNLIDVKIRSGHMDGIFPISFPVTPGWDVAGVVDAAGENATAAVGDEVFGVATAGGYSEYALLDQPVARPAGVPAETASALVTVGEAAVRGLRHLDVKAGQTLLIHGAAGSVGTIAVQLAVARGLTVVDTAAAGVLAESVALTGDASRVITIADEAAAQYGVRFTGADPGDRVPEARAELADLAATGRLSVPIWRIYPLAQAARAHADLEAGRAHGKIIL